MTPIVHITDKEQALQRENANMLDTINKQAVSIEKLRKVVEMKDLTIEAMKADLLPLQRFTDSVIGEFPEHGDLDGFVLQDMAESCGLLVEEKRTKECGEQCACRDYGLFSEWTCYRVQPAMRRAREASARFDAERKEQS